MRQAATRIPTSPPPKATTKPSAQGHPDLESLLLLTRWQDLTATIDNAEAERKELRQRVLDLDDQGIELNDGTIRLSVEEAATIVVNNTLAKQMLKPALWNAVAEVSGTKLKALVTTGQLTQAEFVQMTTRSMSRKVQLRKVSK